MTQPDDDLLITYRGQRAISAPLAAQQAGATTDTMRKTIARLVAAGAIEPLDRKLDDRTPLYPYEALMDALNDRPGKGANLRDRGNPPPLTELEEGQQEFAYDEAINAMAGYTITNAAKDRAAREVVALLWDRIDIVELASGRRGTMSDHRDVIARRIVAGLRAQGASVGIVAVNNAIMAVANVILGVRPPGWTPPHNRADPS